MARPMRYQPQGLQRLADANPLTKGLTFLKSVPGSTQAPTLGAATVTAALATEGKKAGLSTRFTGYGGGTVDTASAGQTAKGTVLVFHQSTVLPPNGGFPNPGYSHVLAATSSGTTTGNGWLLMLGNGDGKLQFRIFDTDNGTPVAVADGATALNDGLPHITIATWDAASGGILRTYVDGTLHATSSASSAAVTIAQPMRIGRSRETNQFWGVFNGNMFLCATWDRILSAEDIRQVSVNPWQLFGAEEDWDDAVAGSPDVTVALTGQAATASAGTLAPTNAVPVTGSSATATPGSVSVSSSDVSAALAGQAATGALGSVGVSVTVALTGIAATASLGTLVGARTIGVTGQAGTASTGSVAPARTVALSGQTAAGQQGNVLIPGDVTVALTGQSMVMAQGDLAAGGAALDHRRRRKYFVRRKDELFVFDNPFDAQAFEQGDDEPLAPAAKPAPRAPKVMPEARVSLPEVVESAPDWAKAKLEKMIEQAQYKRLMDMVAELEEEEELELILLSL